jgi:hypothetical protein
VGLEKKIGDLSWRAEFEEFGTGGGRGEKPLDFVHPHGSGSWRRSSKAAGGKKKGEEDTGKFHEQEAVINFVASRCNPRSLKDV